MDLNRIQHESDQASQKLRSACAELHYVGLRFEAKVVSPKNVLHALQTYYHVLEELVTHNQLTYQLAGIASVPLTKTILKTSDSLSAGCLEVVVQSLTVIVSRGWRQQLSENMGKQLLLLMTLLAGNNPHRQLEPPTDELKCAAFRCMTEIIKCLKASQGSSVFEDEPTKHILDQVSYLLLENLTDNPVDFVQIAAAEALREVYNNVDDRVLLASMMPRTVSSLVKALKPSTKARRTHRVLTMNLELLKVILLRLLADSVALVDNDKGSKEKEVLNESWLKATSEQVKLGLIQVVNLRNHDRIEVRQALSELCVKIIEECGKILASSISIMLETLVILSGHSDDLMTTATLKHLLLSRAELSDMLSSSFYDWLQSLPRIMQSNDDRPKQLMLTRIANSFSLFGDTTGTSDGTVDRLTSAVLKSLCAIIEVNKSSSIQVRENDTDIYMTLVKPDSFDLYDFKAVLLNHESQKGTSEQLNDLIRKVRQHPASGKIIRNVIDVIPEATEVPQLAAIWFALNLLKPRDASDFDIDDLITPGDSLRERSESRSYLIHDLYSFTKDNLLDSSPYNESEQDWRLTALSLETLVLQAQQLGRSYRVELYETLYPILALFSSRHSILQEHAVVTLNLLAKHCEYSSAMDLLVDNVDYLVNSIAWKLNTFNLSPEAPQVLNMILQLVGARLIPYLDDLITSIFTALDSYHGYTSWVEMLFSVLKTMVDEGIKQPSLAITKHGHDVPTHRKNKHAVSTVPDIISDLRARKRRKLDASRIRSSEEKPTPQRPWTKAQDDPTYVAPPPEPFQDMSLESLLKENDEAPLPPPEEKDEDEAALKPLSKSHNLLLKIAEATVPHLSSPSPRVRHLLLQLLSEITPLLAKHENTFLPLVNAIWPGVTQRLFAKGSVPPSNTASSTIMDVENNPEDTEDDVEMSYNIAAAADVTRALCENAGDFMSNRIERILPQLLKTFKDVYSRVENGKKISQAGNLSVSSSNRQLTGTVDFKTIIDNSSNSLTMSSPSSTSITKAATHSSRLQLEPNRSKSSTVLTSLTPLLTTVLTHVSLPPDQRDQILDVLVPFLFTDYGRISEGVRAVLEEVDGDRVWVLLNLE